jgi:predicted ATPase/DNA-binding SARP family transcriptional activator
VVRGVGMLVESALLSGAQRNPTLEIRMLGQLTICRRDAALELPASRKVRALLAYLALAPHAVTRSQLCELLWDVPNDPRGELRWCLSKVRSLVDEPDRRRVVTQADTVKLDLTECFVDATEIAQALQTIDTIALERLRVLAGLFAGDFLDGLEIDNSPAFDGWLTAQRRRFRAYHATLLEHLVKSVADDQALGYLEKWLELAPFDRRVHEVFLHALARRDRFREGDEHLAAAIRLFEAEGLDSSSLRDVWRSAKAHDENSPRARAGVSSAVVEASNGGGHNLPIQVTSFRGRERDLDDLKLQLVEHRLVTLVGAGGVGKTRLAVQLGAEVLERFSDGVWIADLALITDSALVRSVVAKALGVSQGQVHLTEESVTQALKHKQLLVLLDNCEHVLGAAAALADAIHRQCPDVRILATSREALGVSGEKVIRLASLAVPADVANLDPTAALGFGAVALFADRASLVDQTFRLDDDNAVIVSDICRRLDGIPLAIELAAARVKVMSIPSLAEHLNERFKILTGGSRTALPRQKTLSALFDWSYDLLEPEERAMFNRVAIFAGSFTIDGATFACSGDGVESDDVLDLLSSLADKSLVVVDTSPSQERYRVLESTRQYALGKLTSSGEHERLALRHASYYGGLAQEAAKSFGAIPLSEWLTQLGAELENFRAAMDWTLAKGRDMALGGTVAGSLEMFWWHGGAEAEGLRWIETALREIDESEHANVAALLRQAQARLMSRVLYS